MVEDFQKLSSDLEWMLQSNQVNDTILIETLVRHYYEAIFRLALICLTYPEEAHRATQDIFCIVVSKDIKYSEGLSVYDWLAGIAEDICQERKAHIETHQVLNPRLIESIRRRESPEKVTERQLKKAVKEIKAKVKSKNISRGKRARFKELLLLGILLVITFFLNEYIELSVYSSAHNIENNQRTSTFTSSIQSTENEVSARLSFTYSPPTSWPDDIPPQPPLNLDSTHEDILRRISISRKLWNNLWADVIVILYGPSTYIGPPRIERHQIWLDQEIGGIHLSGPMEGKPERFERIDETSLESVSRSFFSGTEDYSRLGSQIQWFYLNSDIILSTPYMTNFFIFREKFDIPPQRVWYKVVDEFDWAGHKAVVVEMTDFSGKILARFWLDALTGLALRVQFPGVNSKDEIMLEIQVSKIEFDVSFPLTIYQPKDVDLLKRGFTQDNLGLSEFQTFEEPISPFQALSPRISPPLNPPPTDFDPSQSWLTFAVEGGSHQRKEARPVHIFGDSNYLGNIEITDLFRTICHRSTDGSRILLAQWPDSSSKVSSRINEYDIRELNLREFLIPETYITFLSYSPHNRHLAVVGISPNKSRSSLYIIDTETSEIMLVPGIEDIWSLAWSLDGNQLAILIWPNFRMYTHSMLNISLYDLELDEVSSYPRYANLPWGKSNIEVLIADWKANFHLAMSGLEPCSAPPIHSP